MAVCIEHMAKNGVKGDVKVLPRENFGEELISYANKENIDMFAATYYTEGVFAYSDNFIQNLITNDKGIPVLTVDGEDVTVGAQFSFIAT